MTASPVAPNRALSPKEWGMLLALAVLWGGSFFFMGVAVTALPPTTIVALRVGLAAMMLNIAILASGLRMPRDRASWTAFFGMGLLNNVVPFCLIAWGQTHIASGLAAILNATTPLWTVIVAHVLTNDEKMNRNNLAGVFAGIVGVVVLIGPAALTGIGAQAMPQLAVVAGALCYAFAGIFGRRFQRMGIAPLLTATGQVTASSIILLPIALLADRPWSLAWPGWPVCAAVLGIATFSTALGYVLYFRILATAGATNLLLVTFLIPVSAIIPGALVLGERLGAGAFIGMSLIGAGLAAIDGRLPRLAAGALAAARAAASRHAARASVQINTPRIPPSG